MYFILLGLLIFYYSTVIPASGLQLGHHSGEGLQTIAMTNTASAGNTIVHYATGTSDGQLIVPVSGSEFGGLKLSSGGVGAPVVLQATTQNNNNIHNQGENMVEEASRKREIRLMKNR